MRKHGIGYFRQKKNRALKKERSQSSRRIGTLRVTGRRKKRKSGKKRVETRDT